MYHDREKYIQEKKEQVWLQNLIRLMLNEMSACLDLLPCFVLFVWISLVVSFWKHYSLCFAYSSYSFPLVRLYHRYGFRWGLLNSQTLMLHPPLHITTLSKLSLPICCLLLSARASLTSTTNHVSSSYILSTTW